MQHIIRTTILILITQAILQTTFAQNDGGQSLRDQLKNNAVTGWQYDRSATSARTVAVNNNEKHDESVATQIRKGTAANMRFMPVPAISQTEPVNTQKAVVAKTVVLPSEQPLRAETAAKIAAPAPPPMQQVANESAAGKKE
jgi:hypothetical protein